MSPSKRSKPDFPVYRTLSAFYILLIIYSSLMPWSGWRLPSQHVLSFLVRPVGEIYRRGMGINFLAYLPLGLLLAGSDRKTSPGRVLLWVTLAGATLSFTMEILQSFVPSRTPSKLDWSSNTAGTLFGAAAIVALRLDTPLRRMLVRLRSEFRPGPVVNTGLAATVLWGLSQWSPFVPFFMTERASGNMTALSEALQSGQYTWQPLQFASQTLYVAALLLLISILRNAGKKGVGIWALLVGCVVLVQPLFYGHPARLEIFSGAGAGILLAFVFLRYRWRNKAAMLMLISGFIAHQLRASSWTYTGFNWIPFWMQLQNRFEGFASILATVWPAMALGCLAVLSSNPVKSRTAQAVTGGVLVAVTVFALEWVQSSRGLGDITTVLLALAGWGVPWLLSGTGISDSDCIRMPSS